MPMETRLMVVIPNVVFNQLINFFVVGLIKMLVVLKLIECVID